MKAVMYGAGSIGRGFIGALFSEIGYEVVFIDVNDDVIHLINKEKTYPQMEKTLKLSAMKSLTLILWQLL